MTTVQTSARQDVRQRRADAFHSFLRAWSIRPNDEFVKLTNGRGQLLTYPENPETSRGELLHQRASFQSRLDAKRALVTPNVCLALPLSGGMLVPITITCY